MWLATATVSVALAQQSHAWAHMRKSELPAAIIALQVRLALLRLKSFGSEVGCSGKVSATIAADVSWENSS